MEREGIKLLKSALLRISSQAQCDYQTLLISFYGATKVSPLLLEEGSGLVNRVMLKNFIQTVAINIKGESKVDSFHLYHSNISLGDLKSNKCIAMIINVR